jgi:hypothetical protein
VKVDKVAALARYGVGGVANTTEREQLLKLLIKRIVFRGFEAEVTMSFQFR